MVVKTKEIQLPQMMQGTIRLRLQGTTPLLTNRFGEDSIGEIERAQQGEAKVGKEPRNPERVFKQAQHMLGESEGRYGFPASGLMKSLVAAGGRFAEEKMTVLRGAISVEPTDGYLLEIISPAPIMRRDPVRLRTGPWTVAYRPQYSPWEMTVMLTYNERALTLEQVLNIVRIAGTSVGIGCWRPETGGTFGKFEIVSAEEVVGNGS